MTEKSNEQVGKVEMLKLAHAGFNLTTMSPDNEDFLNPWRYTDRFDTLSFGAEKEYRRLVADCRFFYRRDPMASSVINKIIELGLTGLTISKGGLTNNQYQIFESIRDALEDYSEACALEYLVSGLLIPEVEFKSVTKVELQDLGIKNYSSLNLPKGLWVRDPTSIVIKTPIIGGEDSYFVEVGEDFRTFIQNKGLYEDGKEDKELYQQILKLYPDLVKKVLNNELFILLDNPNIIRRRVLSDSPYPTPYLSAAIESLKHKRNIRRMDYSLVARVVSGIQQISIGDKDFPLVEGEEEQITELKNELTRRNNLPNSNIERVFQLFTNHTVKIQWIMPPMEAMLSRDKYEEVNLDILQALGFPKILITGEVQRTGTTDADVAILSPVKSMDYLRRKLIRIVKYIVRKTAQENKLSEVPEVAFNPINLLGFKDYISALKDAYEAGNLSRTDYSRAIGVSFEDTVKQLAEDNELLESLGLPEFAPTSHSNSPEVVGDKVVDNIDENTQQNDDE